MLILTVGLPYSGKSTWARSTGYPIVCPDEIRRAVHGHRFLVAAEPLVWAIAKIMVHSLFGAGHMGVVLDATNVSTKRRDEWKSDRWVIGIALATAGTNLCIERALADGDEEIVPVIERMAQEWDALDPYEVTWRIPALEPS